MTGDVRPYTAKVTAVIDGDTIVCDLDLGFYVRISGVHFRLVGINAAEHGTEAGDAAHAHLVALVLSKTIGLTSIKPDKFGGRYDAEATFVLEEPPGQVQRVSLNQYLINKQWAAPWDGKGIKPTPPWPRTVTP